MTGECVLARLLEAGDVIHVCHRHEAGCGRCLTHWQTDAVVTGKPRPVGGRVAVAWAEDARFLGGTARITGVSVFGPDECTLRIGHLEVRSAA
jgi:hypothetical protein